MLAVATARVAFNFLIICILIWPAFYLFFFNINAARNKARAAIFQTRIGRNEDNF